MEDTVGQGITDMIKFLLSIIHFVPEIRQNCSILIAEKERVIINRFLSANETQCLMSFTIRF